MTSPNESTQNSDARESLDPEWQRAFAWVENELGIEIHSFERQARWRPAFFVEATKKGGESISLFLRGDRGELDHGIYPLEHEGHHGPDPGLWRCRHTFCHGWLQARSGNS